MKPSIHGRAVPSLLVRDMAETLSFYGNLGFCLSGHPDQKQPMNWCELRRDDAIIQFFTEAPHGVPDHPCLSGTLYFFTESVATLAASWQDRVMFAWGPEEMPNGQYEFGIQDPNGYFIAFAEVAKA